MKLFILRHAIAEDRLLFALTGKEDSQRPLTPKGQLKFRKTIYQLRALMGPLDLIVTSPFVRARQTASQIRDLYPEVTMLESRALIPEASPEELIDWLKTNLPAKSESVLIVGHETHLSSLASWFLNGASESFLSLKKGGAMALQFKNKPAKGRGTLQWLVTPKCLRLKAKAAD